ncbi:penicillin-binding protein 2 [Bacillus sp. IB182487]|uniref:serine-type D-Ala-D-Ala carboxypeptidase n=2 Tax=Metabacillus arenae TaxID=2771434 RepID=A0A926NH18_9BACI|nr:penicillin-binding protein 2 [Metabacillus arenae]
MNIFFFLVFMLFAALIVRLGVVQIVQGEEYTKEVKKTESNIASFPAPRGKMYDRFGNVIVDNKSIPAITYTQDKKAKAEEKIKIAKKLAELIEVSPDLLKEKNKDEFKERYLQDYWLAAHTKEAAALLEEKELKLKPAETYQLQLTRIDPKEIEKIKQSPEELEIAAIYTRFTSGYYYQPSVVKSENLTDEEVSVVAEHLEELPGVDVITDWDREYPFGDVLRPILGSVTSPEQGILSERENFYLSRGYARNDRVGKSYLEYHYEDYLNPIKSKVELIEDKNGNIISEQLIDEGRRGYDLQLSFDMELQKRVGDIIEKEIRAAKGFGGNHTLERAFVVMMDPNQGDILAMAGKQIDPDNRSEFLDFSTGTFASQYEMGSTVKGATVLAGYQHGVPHGQGYSDQPIYLAGGVRKSSWTNLGWVNDVTALEESSNIYMFRLAMEIAGETYTRGGGFNASNEDFQRMRNYFSQFGLGVPTGVDLPQESAGQQGNPTQPGLLLDISIGQYDTYTPLQMAQYVSTIANGGYRIQPRIMKTVHAPNNEAKLGPVIKENNTTVLNRINNTPGDLQKVQTGFKRVTTSGTAAAAFDHDVAGKTGTAESFYYGNETRYRGNPTYNLTFVGYYPSNNPEVAFSVVVPWAGDGGKSGINKKIASGIVNAYVDLKEQRAKGEVPGKQEETE